MGALSLQSLPDELLDLIFDSLPYSTLCNLALTSRWGYVRTVPLLWQNLNLVDAESQRCVPRNHAVGISELAAHSSDGRVIDQHDETRILKKLFVLATNAFVASKVRTITHRCHLPTPELFEELPNLRHDDSISFDQHAFGGRRHTSTYVRMVLQAVANMRNVHTLIVITGHSGLTQALVWGFFGPHRKANVPVRRLWLESCCIRDSYHDTLWTPLDFSQVESLRLRRLWFQYMPYLLPHTSEQRDPEGFYLYDRGNTGAYEKQLRTNTADYYSAYVAAAKSYHGMHIYPSDRRIEIFTVLTFEEIIACHQPSVLFVLFIQSLEDQDRQFLRASEAPQRRHRAHIALKHNLRDAFRIRSLDAVLRLIASTQSTDYEDALRPFGNFECRPSRDGLTISDKLREDDPSHWSNTRLECVYFCESSCLTSLTLDWIIFQSGVLRGHKQSTTLDQCSLVLNRICSLQFPQLHVFQLRNCVSATTQLGANIFLFQEPANPDQKTFLDFLEAHDRLECLAWPMDRFFPPEGIAKSISQRVANAVANLGRTLTDLRVDVTLSSAGEPVTDEAAFPDAISERRSRHLFITEFAQHMRSLTSIKMEGGIPRDEKRETARALRHCPLDKLVFIGASFPLINTWGEAGQYLWNIDDSNSMFMPALQEENEEMLFASTAWSTSDSTRQQYDARFGRDREPMLYTLASLFTRSIRELKFCGYIGAAVLQQPSPVTHPALHHLRGFYELRELALSFWVLTFFDHAPRDAEIIRYWLDMRSPRSTALTIVPPLPPTPPPPPLEAPAAPAAIEVNPIHEAAADAPEEPLDAGRWLYDNYHPENLAIKVKDFIGPHLSPAAKARGLRVRASFCLGCVVQDIFDFDIRIGLNASGEDVVLDHIGPRENSWDSGRSAEKLAGRRWFY